MGGRYLVSGVQLGLIQAISEDNDIHELVEEIIENQFAFNRGSHEGRSIQDDVKLIHKLFAERRAAIWLRKRDERRQNVRDSL